MKISNVLIICLAFFMMSTTTAYLANYFYKAKSTVAILEEENHNTNNEKKADCKLIKINLAGHFNRAKTSLFKRKKIYCFHFSEFNKSSDLSSDLENPPEA